MRQYKKFCITKDEVKTILFSGLFLFALGFAVCYISAGYIIKEKQQTQYYGAMQINYPVDHYYAEYLKYRISYDVFKKKHPIFNEKVRVYYGYE